MPPVLKRIFFGFKAYLTPWLVSEALLVIIDEQGPSVTLIRLVPSVFLLTLDKSDAATGKVARFRSACGSQELQAIRSPDIPRC